jgi:uncharacterized protein (DUF885 family)
MAPALTSLPVRGASPQPNKATQSLLALFASEWDYTMEQNPTWASALGDRRWNDRWPDLSLTAVRNRHEHAIETLGHLRRIDRRKLSARDQLNYDLFEREQETKIEEHQYRWHLIPLNQRAGIQTADELADSLRFETVKDFEDWLERLRSFPAYLDQTVDLMREGIRARIVQPKITMQRIPAQIDKQIVDEPEASPFYKPFKAFPDAIPRSDQERLGRAAKKAITEHVVPGFNRFKEFFVGEYLPACFDQVGAWQLPEGNALYAFLARKFTTTRLTPREIHDLGLREVKRIRTGMEQIMDKVGFQGTLQEFFKHLRTDPQFYCTTAEELLMTYRAVTRQIDPQLVKIFRTDTTTAYYRPPAADGSRAGTYFVNLFKPETRPKHEMMALSLHEAVPGHHFQIALAMEQGELPNFRRYGGYTAYVEGWGLYAESLGEDMGLYHDPYSKFGQLTYEMWRAVRLVVDTGIHHLRWDRQKAIDFFLENAAKTELDVVNEVDRYISWPGQALAYKIGELKIKELRARARQALGEPFDLREFHDVVLKPGAVPLDILERTVDAWIAAEKK